MDLKYRIKELGEVCTAVIQSFVVSFKFVFWGFTVYVGLFRLASLITAAYRLLHVAVFDPPLGHYNVPTTSLATFQVYQPLKGKALAMIFEKRSTRTRMSTESGTIQAPDMSLQLHPNVYYSCFIDQCFPVQDLLLSGVILSF